MVLKGKHRETTIEIWPTTSREPLIVEPGRVRAFRLPGDALFNATRKQKCWVIVTTEAADTFKRRARMFWQFAADYGALVEVATAPADMSNFSM